MYGKPTYFRKKHDRHDGIYYENEWLIGLFKKLYLLARK